MNVGVTFISTSSAIVFKRGYGWSLYLCGGGSLFYDTDFSWNISVFAFLRNIVLTRCFAEALLSVYHRKINIGHAKDLEITFY